MAQTRNIDNPLTAADGALAIANDEEEGIVGYNKNGRATNVTSSKTDIWDGSNSTDAIYTWLAPTQARVHQVKSTSANDTVGGVGCQTLRIWYLPDWDTKEAFVDVPMNGTTNVATPSLVMINRMESILWGATDVNVGKITAIADVDTTTTAIVLAGKGKTQMAVFGVPSVQNVFVTQVYFSLLKLGGATAYIDGILLKNSIPQSQTASYIEEWTTGKLSTGTSDGTPHGFKPYRKISGPCILKLESEGAGAASIDVSAGFDMILIDK